MAVNFTTYIALAKPDKNELAVNWIEGTQLYDDNTTIIEAKTNIPVVSYTPVITATSVAPTLGTTGAIRGEYVEVQGFIFGNYVVEFTGTGITSGTGEYAISLPSVIDNVFHTVVTSLNSNIGTASCIGEGFIFDADTFATNGEVALDAATVAGVSYVRMCTESHVGKTSRLFRDANPFTMSTGDKFTGTFFYKKL